MKLDQDNLRIHRWHSARARSSLMTWRRQFQRVLTVHSDTSDSRQSCQSKLSAQIPRPEDQISNKLVIGNNEILILIGSWHSIVIIPASALIGS
jgi:hypothetical protein